MSDQTGHTSRSLLAWEVLCHQLDRTNGHVQLVHVVLGEVAELEVAVGRPLAGVRSVLVHDQLQQRRFARTVLADNAYPGVESGAQVNLLGSRGQMQYFRMRVVQ